MRYLIDRRLRFKEIGGQRERVDIDKTAKAIKEATLYNS